MRLSVLIVSLSFSFVASVVADAAAREGEAYHIVLPRRALRAGEHVELRLEPPPPSGARVTWWVSSGTELIGLLTDTYRAPFVVPAGAPPARVSVAISGSGVRATASTEIELTTSSVPGAADCLGPGQSFSKVVGDIEPGFTYDLDGLPELTRRVDPEYPMSAFARGVEDTIGVRAFVCRDGHVLDAHVLQSYLVPGGEPILRDPQLVDAALAAVRQYTFKPATKGGQPIAFWIHLPVVFRR